MAKIRRPLRPIHPGEILRAEFMEPLKLSMNRLALDLHVPVTRVAEIVHERRGITPDTALRLARYFQTSARFWLNLQSAYDLEVAEDELSRTIEREYDRVPRLLLPLALDAARRSTARRVLESVPSKATRPWYVL